MFLILCAIYTIWVFFVGGRFDVDTNVIVFTKVFKQFYEAVGAGRHFYFPPMQSLHTLEIGLQPIETIGTTSIALKATQIAGNLPGNPRNKVTIKYTLIWRVIGPYKAIMEMPGSTSLDKEELLKSRFQDRLQTWINEQGMGEDEIIQLTGEKIQAGIDQNIFEEWGIKLQNLEIGETEIDEATQEQRKKGYEAFQERENRTRILDGIANDLFGKSLSELKPNEREVVNQKLEVWKSIDAYAAPGTRIVIGDGSREIREMAYRTAITSRKDDDEDDQ